MPAESNSRRLSEMIPDRRKFFTLTEEHVKLLRRAYVNWDACEFGAPAIDPKRPYGNSDVLLDIAEILEEPLFEDAGGEKHLSAEQAERSERLHKETQMALAVILRTGSFEPGRYSAGEYTQDWERMPEP
jgi:hypothetical protein